MKGERLGYLSMIIGVIFGIIILISLLVPGPASYSDTGLLLGIGTIVATIYLTIAMLR
jgi:hypothetical protein